MICAVFACFFALLLPLAAAPETPDAIAKEILAPLLDPVKVKTLKGEDAQGRPPANARQYRVLGWLETARQAGGDISAVIDTAQTAAGYGGTKGAAPDMGTAAVARHLRHYSKIGVLRVCPKIELHLNQF